jgi:hypothetical protein
MPIVHCSISVSSDWPLQVSDSTLREFVIARKDPEDYFHNFVSLGEGCRMTVTNENSAFFRSTCCELWNEELLKSIFDHYDNDITCNTVFGRLQFLVAAHESCDREIEFCSSHFFELEISKLHEMPFKVICAIVLHHSLKLQNEDSLYEFITNLVVDESRYSSLFEHVRFGYLSCELMCSFIEVIRKSFEFLTLPIWDALCDRLSLSVSPATSNNRLVELFNSIVCSSREDSPLNGIIS